MRLFKLLICALCLIVTTSLFAKDVITHIEVKGKTPKGVVIGKEKVTLKKGYIVEKVSPTRAISRMRGGRGGITGDFDCTCNGENGGCSVVTTPNSVTCISSGCNSCYMIVTVPGKAILHQ